MSDYDKQQWQAEQAAREEAQTAFRDKMAKSRERSARNARRKIARLHAKLTELGHISEFEDEFGESVLERLEKYGSAFHDPEKGRAGDALSSAQRQVVSRMNKKVKELKAKRSSEASEHDPDADYSRSAGAWASKQKKGLSSKKGFGHKNFTPRVRQVEEDMPEESALKKPDVDFSDPKIEPFLPEYVPEPPKVSAPKKPFLRLVRSEN
tara:strand:+ start:698 stop:1324 length:627 start_codon:yes stop_codon:yes gene_type:complete